MTRIEELNKEIELTKELIKLQKELNGIQPAYPNQGGPTNVFVGGYVYNTPSNPWPASEEMWSNVEKPHYQETTYCLKATKEK